MPTYERDSSSPELKNFYEASSSINEVASTPKRTSNTIDLRSHQDWWSPTDNSQSAQPASPHASPLSHKGDGSPYAYYAAYASASDNDKNKSSYFRAPQNRTYPKSPGHQSIRSVQSGDLEDCVSEKSLQLGSTPRFSSIPESSAHQLDLGMSDFPKLSPQSGSNEIKREAQSIQRLNLSSSSLIHKPEPIRRGYYIDTDSTIEKPDLDDDSLEDDEHNMSILNSLPTPRIPSSKINGPQSHHYAELGTYAPAGPASGPTLEPLGPPMEAPSGISSSESAGNYLEPSYNDFGLDSIQQLPPVVHVDDLGPQHESSHNSPQISYSSREGSSRVGDAFGGSQSPRITPQRPKSVLAAPRSTKRQSYYDFGTGSSSKINLNLADAVAKEHGSSGMNTLLPRMKTIELYRKNAKKSNDPDLEFQLAQYMMQTALIASAQREHPLKDDSKLLSITSSNLGSSRNSSVDISPATNHLPSPTVTSTEDSGIVGTNGDALSGGSSLDNSSESMLNVSKFISSLFKDAMSSLKRLSDRGYADAQYLLGDIYSSPAVNNAADMEKSFKYFSMAAKHNHAEAAYRAALCLQEGWGTNRDAGRALQFYKSAAVRNQPGALYQLGMAYFYGGMGLPDNSANRQAGVKWLSRAVNNATTTFNRAPFELGKIYEVGYKDLVIPDEHYSAKLYSRSAELGFVPAAARLGRAYEFGELGCPQDPSLSIHYFTIAALGNDPNAQLSMCAWYMVGAGPSFPINRDEAYEWCLRAALNKLPKAQYTLGFFLENGFGCQRNILEASRWYRKAAANGYEKAKKRVKEMGLGGDEKPKGKCVVM